MNFECKELIISDDSGFGCTIEFSDTIDTNDENQSLEELMNPKNKYLLIQVSYPEYEDEINWYTVESSEAEIQFNQKDNMYVKLNRDQFDFYCSGVNLIVGLNLSDLEYSNLEKVLKTQFRDKVVFL